MKTQEQQHDQQREQQQQQHHEQQHYKQQHYEQQHHEQQTQHQAPLPATSTKRFVLPKLVGVSGIVMASILPIGLVPRLMQQQELNQVESRQLEQKMPTVSVTKPQPVADLRTLNLPGTTEAIVDTLIYARTNGYISERYVDIGDHVKKGQLLAKIQTPEIDDSEREAQAQLMTSIAAKAQSEANVEKARADIQRAQADLLQAKANVVENESEEEFALSTNLRYKALGTEGAVSAQDVDEKRTRYKSSQAARAAAEQRVRAAQSEVFAAKARLLAEQANVKLSAANIAAATAHAQKSQTEKSFQNVLSPFDGIITVRNIDQGMLISSGSDNSRTPLYKLARIDTIKVFVDVPQYAASSIRSNQSVDISLKEFPGVTYKGEVVRTAVALDSNARTLKVEIHIRNSDFKLAPGMYADVSFALPRQKGTVQIPANSLIVNSDGTQVLAIVDGKVHYRRVKIGQDLGKLVEVTSGLSTTDTLVVNPADTLIENMEVSASK